MTSPMQAKIIKSLQEKKYREKTGKFIVEGRKNILELLDSDFLIEIIYVTKDFKGAIIEKTNKSGVEVVTVDIGELRAYGTLEHNDSGLAIVRQKPSEAPKTAHNLILALEDIRDPGNLGTIIRIADWYGITNIICSSSCVDWYSPKVINSTMGSFTRVRGFYTDLPQYLSKTKLPILGTFLKGKSVHTFKFPENGILVIGSESHGISRDIEKLVTEKVTIPSFGKAESLNAGIATAIVLDRWKGSL